MMLRVTDLKQWAYCRRIVYYLHRMPGVGKQTYKMGEGKAAQDMVEQLEMRRTLREYGFEGAVRKFGVWLENEDLGLAGKLDLLLETDTEAAIVEFKLTSGEVGHNHRLQLAGYSLLVETVLAKAVKLSLIHISRSEVRTIRSASQSWRSYPSRITFTTLQGCTSGCALRALRCRRPGRFCMILARRWVRAGSFLLA